MLSIRSSVNDIHMGDLMTDRLFHIYWAAWHMWCIVLPIALVVCIMLCVRWVRQRAYVRRMVAPEHHAHVLTRTSSPLRGMKSLVYAIATICIALALLRPQWGRKEESVTQEGRDVVIALDISRSMLAQDMTPDRLTCAKRKISQLVDHLSAERVALVIFSADAVVQCPLTRDRGAFQLFLDGITSQTISSGSTVIQRALSTAAHVFTSQTLGDRHRLVVLMTDGEDFGSDYSRMYQTLQDEELRVFVVGLGTPEGAPVPDHDTYGNHVGYKRDSQGNIAISRCNTYLAQQVAHTCGGVYVQAHEDDRDIDRIQQWVQHFEKQAQDECVHTSYIERYYICATVALLLLALEWLL